MLGASAERSPRSTHQRWSEHDRHRHHRLGADPRRASTRLVALGLTLQYGVARIMNLAYGEFLVAARLRRLLAVHGQRDQPARRADRHRAGGLRRQLADLRRSCSRRWSGARSRATQLEARLDPLHLRPALRHAGDHARRSSAASSTAIPTSLVPVDDPRRRRSRPTGCVAARLRHRHRRRPLSRADPDARRHGGPRRRGRSARGAPRRHRRAAHLGLRLRRSAARSAPRPACSSRCSSPSAPPAASSSP